MDAKAVIEFRGVSKRFVYWQDRPRDLKKVLSNLFTKNMFGKIKNEWTVLSDVSFKISEGEFVGIMGRNGAGKSTLLKMISKIYYPTEGEIFLAGKIAPVLELGAGFADELSGLENIYLNAAILGFGAKRTEQLVDQIISFSELGEQVMQPVRNYSSGMLVRLGFSIACHLDAPILLFDEVLAVGDMGFQKKCLAKIYELHKRGRSIVLVTHSPNDVERYCTRCILINETKVIFDGDPVAGAQKYRELF